MKTTTENTGPVVFFLAYHKTASKWIWGNFLSKYYPNKQLNILAMPVADVRDLVQANKTRSPLVLRQRVEDGTMGRGLDGLADAMAAACPGAQVVVSIRSQRSMLASHYGQYVTNGGRLGFGHYLANVAHVKWHYYPMLKSLQDRFRGRLLVHLFEDFRADPYSTLCRLRDFIGVPSAGLSDNEIRIISDLPPVNPQRNDLMIDAMLLLNRLRLRHNGFVPQLARRGHDHILVEVMEIVGRTYKRRFGKPLRYRRYDDRGILGRVYGEENAAVSELLGRSLRELGYPA